jgi:hypothetical protein
MANTFGQSKADETSAWQNNKEMNPAENSSVTDDALEDSDNPGDTSWRPTDSPLESATDAEFDETEEKNRNKQVHTDSPGVTPDIAE